jgi:hypothetical protein
MHYFNPLLFGIYSFLMQANVETGSGGNVPPVQMPQVPMEGNNPDPKLTALSTALNKAVQMGQERAKAIMTAEQGIVIANNTAVKTRLDGLVEIANLEEIERSQYIGATDNAFRVIDGDKLSKAHSNYQTDLRRVSAAIKRNPDGKIEGEPTKADIIGWLTAPTGTYPEKIAKVPTASRSGGSNRGTGVAGITQEAKAQVAAGADPATLKVTTEPNPAAALSTTPQANASTPKVAQQPTASVKELTAHIAVLHENMLEPVGIAFANRLKLSPVPSMQELGAMLLDFFAKGDIEHATEQAAQTAVAS